MAEVFGDASAAIQKQFGNRMSTRGLRPDQMRAFRAKPAPVWIFNVGFMGHSKNFIGIGRLVVDPCPAGQSYSLRRLDQNQLSYWDKGDRQLDVAVVEPTEMAEDLLGIPGHLPPEWGLDLRQMGLFLSDRPPQPDPDHPEIRPLAPTQLQKMLDEANRKLDEWCHKMYRQADTFWADPKMRVFIVEAHRAAALRLDERGQILAKETPWVGRTNDAGVGIAECDACGAPIKKTARKCRYCGEVQAWYVKQQEAAGKTK